MKNLYKGNEAIAEAAIRAGCRCYFGYPITPQNEIPEYFSKRMPEVGGHFVQAESEIASINMVYGAAGAGARAMTSSSSPGISLKQEGISYLAGARLPCVIVNMMRAGPGLGGILAAQGDYFQAVKGGGHGDYKTIVYAPNSVSEVAQLTYKAFDKADEYRLPAIILADGVLGQMMEPAELPQMRDINELPKKSWTATGGHHGKDVKIINSLYIDPDALESRIADLYATWRTVCEHETQSEEYMTADAEIIFAAYGIVSRVCKAAVDLLREKNVKAGLFRPITLSPFPTGAIERLCGNKNLREFIAVELSMGQMIEDIRLAVNGRKPVKLINRVGGNLMTPEDIVAAVLEGKL